MSKEMHIVVIKPSTNCHLAIKKSSELSPPTLKLTGSAKRWHPDRTRAAAEPWVLCAIQHELERGGDSLVGVGLHLDIEPAEAVA